MREGVGLEGRCNEFGIRMEIKKEQTMETRMKNKTNR